MKIKWLGHSCFKITDGRGVRIVTDPFDNTVGYKAPNVEADIVTTSHNHFDHNFAEAVEGEFELINKAGMFYAKDINIQGIHSYHDNSGGKKRGDNTIYTFDIGGIKVCHLGDLGHVLNDKQLSEIGGVDVLLIPIGGNFTIDANGAQEVIGQLKPSIIIPMHFKTPAINFPIDGVEPFLKLMGEGERLESQILEVDKQDFVGQRKVYVLQYE